MIGTPIRTFGKTYVIKSVASESFDANGYAVKTYGANRNITAVIQPMRADELRNVPEGQNSLEWIKLFSLSELKLKDIITYRSVNYEIQKVESWIEDELYYRSEAVKVKE